MPPELLLAFTIAVITFAFTPGPSIFYVLARTLAEGRNAGLAAALGCHAGGYVHTIAAATGLTLLLENAPTLFTALKLCGAAYIIYLGFKMIFQPGHQVHPTTGRTSFFQSALLEIVNPTTALFFLAFLPQFVVPDAQLGVMTQMLILGVIVNLTFSAADLFYIFTAHRMQRAFKASPAATRAGRRLGGGVLIGLGISLGSAKT
ncbi:MAG: LysE family translocator [Pseudomonadota bacterium]